MTSSYSASKYMTLPVLLEGISQYPVDDNYRFRFWVWALTRKLSSPVEAENPIEFYLSHIEGSDEATCLSSGQLGEIMRDVGRTFPEHPIFVRDGVGEAMLANILKATVSVRPDIGYCQGMNFVVGALLLGRLGADSVLYQHLLSNASLSEEYFPSSRRSEIESEIFWATQCLLANRGEGVVGDYGILQMESIWSPGFPKMKIRVYQFDRLFKWNLPELHSHCENILLSTEVMVSQWFMTLFAYMFPLDYTHHIWDYIFPSGWPGVFKVTLALLYALSDKLLNMDLEQVGLMIRDWKRGKFSLDLSVAEVLQSAERFHITVETLNTLQEGYALEIIKAALTSQASVQIPRSRKSDPQAVEDRSYSKELESVSEVYKELVDLQLQVEKDKEVIQKKILLACEACESTTTKLNKAIQEEAIWIEKTTEIKFELEKWTTKVTTLVSVLHGIDESNQVSTAALPDSHSHEEVGGVMSQIIGIAEGVDIQDDYQSDDVNTQDDSSSTIEEEHARLAEEYEDEDCGYEDENASVETSTSSLSEPANHVEMLITEEEYNDSQIENERNKKDGIQGSPTHKRNNSGGVEESSQEFFNNLLKPLADRKTSPEFFQASPQSIKEENNGSRYFDDDSTKLEEEKLFPSSPPPTITPTRSSPEHLSVVEKMKIHPNRRRIVGIVQNTSVSYRNSVPVATQNRTSSTVKPQLDDPSIIADSLIRARNISLESSNKDGNSEESASSPEKVTARPVDEGAITEEKSDLNHEESGVEGNKLNEYSEDPSPEAENETKSGLSAFKFSSKIREGLDIIYRATVPPSGNGKGSSNSLLALAEKEKHRWIRKKSDGDRSPSDSSESKNSRMGFPKNGFGLLSRERLISNRKKNQMVKECRKLQLKVAKLTRALDVAKRRLHLASSTKMEALMADEESKQWKESLCHQFQLLVEDSSRCRSQKLLYIAENCG